MNSNNNCLKFNWHFDIIKDKSFNNNLKRSEPYDEIR